MNIVSALSVHPVAWGRTLNGAPTIDRRIASDTPALIRRWQGIDPAIDQSALDQHFISVHLGGAKRLHRKGDGHRLTRDVPAGAYSVVPAGAAFEWMTEGPVDFMHVYFDPRTIDHFVASAFDRDPRGVDMADALGACDPLVAELGAALADEAAAEDDMQQAYVDHLLQLLLFQVMRAHSNVRDNGSRAPHALAPYRLRRAIEFIEERLADPIGVADIAAAAGISPFHFSRGFRKSTGAAPYAYLLNRRIAMAKRLIVQSEVSVAEAAARCGFASNSQFSRMFKRVTGVAPRAYRERQ